MLPALLLQVLGTETAPVSPCCPAQFKLLSTVRPMYWASLFTPPAAPPGEAYLLGTSGTDQSFGVYCRNVVISKTTDGGTSWLEPAVLFPCEGNITYHTAPTPVLVDSAGKLHRAFEATGKEGAAIISTKIPYNRSVDLLDPRSWVRSSVLHFDRVSMVPPSWGNTTFVWEEGNAVEGPDGDVYNILRIDGQTPLAYNKAAVTKLDQASGELSFVKMIDFPACESKFVIRRDVTSKLYYTLSTDVTPEALQLNTIFARNHLILAVSSDLFNWRFCDTLLTDDTGFDPLDSAKYTGFHYLDWQFDDDDIVFAARTGYRGTFVPSCRAWIPALVDAFHPTS